MNAAQMSVAKLLRPPWNFEEDYSDVTGVTPHLVNGDVPIFFTHPFTLVAPAVGTPDYATVVDPEALQANPPAGISPVLAKFVPCSLGSTMLISYPVIDAPTSDTCFAYVWRVVFRLRTVADYQRRKKNRVRYSIGISRFGTADSRHEAVVGRPSIRLDAPGARVVRPCSLESAIYNRTEPWPGERPPYFSTIFGDAVAIPANYPSITIPARYPGYLSAGAWPDPGSPWCRNLDYEQGERDPGLTSPDGVSPTTSASHVSRFVKCQGDEFAVECFKFTLDTLTGRTTTPRYWDFTFAPGGMVNGGEDINFSRLLGVGMRISGGEPSIDTGVRVIQGTSPT
jgi:hypothetical protein